MIFDFRHLYVLQFWSNGLMMAQLPLHPLMQIPCPEYSPMILLIVEPLPAVPVGAELRPLTPVAWVSC